MKALAFYLIFVLLAFASLVVGYATGAHWIPPFVGGAIGAIAILGAASAHTYAFFLRGER